MQDETRETLQLIVDKAEKLRGFAFERHVARTGLGFSARRMADDSWEIDFGLPDEKERDAFLLTFRLFYQRNEPMSFLRLDELLNDPDLSEEFTDVAVQLRASFLRYLEGQSHYTVELFEGQPTRKQMIDVGLYGGIAHANNPTTVAQYREWTRDEVRAALFHQEFTKFLVVILGMIYALADAARAELLANPA
jgi:hypothetical protein